MSRIIGPERALVCSHGWSAAEPVAAVANYFAPKGQRILQRLLLIEHVPLVELDFVGAEHPQELRLEAYGLVMLQLSCDVRL